ncbi:hypothetical protein G9A89_011512 [Geosiphon pyriformis]|nr:hypothetical protein G9A89_011512 [Geosiphon pyriformis]
MLLIRSVINFKIDINLLIALIPINISYPSDSDTDFSTMSFISRKLINKGSSDTAAPVTQRYIEPPKQKEILWEGCGHPKHDVYLSTTKPTKTYPKSESVKRKLYKAPDRIIGVVGVKEKTLMCSHCLFKTEKDPEYLQNPEFIPRKRNRRHKLIEHLKIEMNDDGPRKKRIEIRITDPSFSGKSSNV